jgi:hypothetical protein
MHWDGLTGDVIHLFQSGSIQMVIDLSINPPSIPALD